jgi:hypothetical protein
MSTVVSVTSVPSTDPPTAISGIAVQVACGKSDTSVVDAVSV